jgi:NAD(P)H dehydrogenase (quinone)
MMLVAGATGHVGRAVVSSLASLGHEVVAMVRDVQAASRRLPSGIALRVADYEDASALKRALADIDDMVLISGDGDGRAVTGIVDTDELWPFYFSPVYRDAEHQLAVCSVPSAILGCGLYSDFILKHWLVPGQTLGELVLPTGHGRVARSR